MQRNTVVQKRKVEADGVPHPNLKSLGEFKTAYGVVEIAAFDEKNDVTDGSIKMEPIPFEFNLKRDGIEKDSLFKWHDKREQRDLTVIFTDGSGIEIVRWLLLDVEISEHGFGEYDAGAPDAFLIKGVFIPTGRARPIAAQ